ncbi:MAG TPA: ATP-binding protein [Chloroflexota bacterium]|nr:ATP-binding protein [Chloroflexota bacterium]
MNRLFAGIRWRLVAWSMLILGTILVLLGTTIYVAVARSLVDEVDRNLYSRSEQAGPQLFPPPGRGRGPQEYHEGYSGGVFYVGLRGNGEVLNPQRVDYESATWPVPDGRQTTIETITLDGEPTRVVARGMPDGGVLYVGQSLEPEQAALRSLLLVLFGGGALGLLLSFVGAWILSGRALVPIQHAFRRQQEFVADASHELRTPLTVLRSSTDLLNQHRTETLAKNGELWDDVRGEIARMERLAADLLTLARSDRGELELMVAPLELSDLANDVVRRTVPLAQAAEVQLSMQACDRSAIVEADPDRLQQVLLILLDNAIKHTPPGGRVDVRVERDGSCGLLRVADTGSGIAAEHLPRIFDRFYRIDGARTWSGGGTGLGLAIAKMLVDAHNGELSVSSTHGVGTTVTVRLPLADHHAGLGERLGDLKAQLTAR